jgi:hypothetical protein
VSPRSDIAMSPDPSLTVKEPVNESSEAFRSKTDDWPFWDQALRRLQERLDPATFADHLHGAEGIREGGRLVIAVRRPASVFWLDGRLRPTVERVVHGYDEELAVEFAPKEAA